MGKEVLSPTKTTPNDLCSLAPRVPHSHTATQPGGTQLDCGLRGDFEPDCPAKPLLGS